MEDAVREAIEELLRDYPHLTINEMAEDLSVEFGNSCHNMRSQIREVQADQMEEALNV